MKSKAAFFVGVLTGSVVGGITALLFAPKSGKELRADIKEGAEKVVEVTAKAVDQVTESVYDATRQLEDRSAKLISGAKLGVQNIVGGVKQAYSSNESEQLEQPHN